MAKFKSIISELVKKEVAAARKSLQSGIISDLERSANEHLDQLIDMQVNIAKLSATVESLGKNWRHALDGIIFDLRVRPRGPRGQAEGGFRQGEEGTPLLC